MLSGSGSRDGGGARGSGSVLSGRDSGLGGPGGGNRLDVGGVRGGLGKPSFRRLGLGVVFSLCAGKTSKEDIIGTEEHTLIKQIQK